MKSYFVILLLFYYSFIFYFIIYFIIYLIISIVFYYQNEMYLYSLNRTELKSANINLYLG